MKIYAIIVAMLVLCDACTKDVEPTAPDTTPNNTVTIPAGATEGEIIIKFKPEMEAILDATMTRTEGIATRSGIPSTDEVLALCRNKLPPYQIPSKITISDKPDFLASGKKKRKKY